MPRLPADCFAHARGHIGLRPALDLLAERTRPVVEAERIRLDAAHGRILAQPLVSPRDVPAFDNAAVDGYAMASTGLEGEGPHRLKLIEGRAAAGHPFAGTVPEGAALRVLTGAMMPQGSDAVVMQEEAAVEGAEVVIRGRVRAGSNRRRAGEDVARDATLFAPGLRLLPQHVGVAAELGQAELEVFRRLRVAVFSSGDEITEPGRALAPGGVYDANRHILLGLLAAMPVEIRDLGILPDEAEPVRNALREAAATHDVVLTSGGASMGDEDHVVRSVEAEGRLDFWQIAMKPGRPLAFGTLEGAVFIGLPGNPVATMVCFLRIARPVLMRLAGGQWREPQAYPVPAGFAMTKKPGRNELMRARLGRDDSGGLRLERVGREGSGILTSMTDADGLVELAAETTRICEGTPLPFLSFTELGALG